MSKITLLASLILLCVSLPKSYAKVWRVNNNTNVTADFTTLAAAHTGASSGDTIHLEGSPTSYGALTCTKKLVIIGPGYFLTQNPNNQALKQTAKVGAIDFNGGSAGSELMGVDLDGSSVRIYSNDIIIKRNKCSSTSSNNNDWIGGTVSVNYLNNNSATPANNIIITQNYGVRIDVNYASTGVLISNNYIAYGLGYGETTSSASLSMSTNAIALVQNNIFRNGKVIGYNSNFTNNIMVAGFFEGTGNLVANNIGSGTQFGTDNGNKSNVDMSTVFVGTSDNTVSPDGQWKLKSGSPAIGAGYGSTAGNPVDAGMFGGQAAYVLAGIPPIPSIYFFENQPIGSNSDPIDVTVKVKSNN